MPDQTRRRRKVPKKTYKRTLAQKATEAKPGPKEMLKKAVKSGNVRTGRAPKGEGAVYDSKGKPMGIITYEKRKAKK